MTTSNDTIDAFAILTTAFRLAGAAEALFDVAFASHGTVLSSARSKCSHAIRDLEKLVAAQDGDAPNAKRAIAHLSRAIDATCRVDAACHAEDARTTILEMIQLAR